MDAAEVLACQFSGWYPRFKHLAYRSMLLDLPAEFAAYLQQDGAHLAAGSPAVSYVLWSLLTELQAGVLTADS